MLRKLLLTIPLILWAIPVFAQSVDTAWVRRYNGSANDPDETYAIAVDGSGNVCVTGWIINSGTGQDYVTIKYHPNGDTAWVRTYDGPAYSSDQAFAIAVDDSGNVCVTGRSYGTGRPAECVTIKYYPNGDTAWVRRYNGPTNSGATGWAIAVDGSGNVCVTGHSGTYPDDDYATIKYYPNGATAWVRMYNGPADSTDWALAMAVDDSGNVYVTGRGYGTGTTEDYATIKYDSSGNELWVRRYNGQDNSTDRASGIAADGSGNVYVTGYSYGNGTSYDYATIKYYPNGDTAWVRRYNGPGDSTDIANAIAVDGSGNICVTGRSYSTETRWDYGTVKYYPNGDTAWVRKYNGQENYYDEALAIAIDNSDNVYASGLSRGNGSYHDCATTKYDSNGNELWVQRYNGPADSSDGANAITVDASGNVYVTGWSYDSATHYDCITIKHVQFLRGDVDKDGEVNIVDVVYLINYLFKSGAPPVPAPIVGNASCDSNVDITDIIYLIHYLFRGGPAPCI